jgi:hypothetical protein
VTDHAITVSKSLFPDRSGTSRGSASWDRARWDHAAEQALIDPEDELDALVGRIAQAIDVRGFAHVRMGWLPRRDESMQVGCVSAICAQLGESLKVFGRQRSLWRGLEVDLTRPTNRSSGTGEQPLHLDFVNTSNPPDYVYLYCRRPDPLGGGANTVGSTIGIPAELSHQARRALRERTFRDGQVIDLVGVGHDINPFAVLNPGGRIPVRYTGRLLETTTGPAKAAVEELKAVLDQRTVEVMLEPGDLLILDQRRAAHGRKGLGEGQELLQAAERRLLMHGFGRARSSPRSNSLHLSPGLKSG